MGEWKACTLGDLGTVVGGATPSTKKSENYDSGTIAWITPKDLAGFTGRFISKGERNITDIGLRSCSTQLMPAHTVLFSSRAPIGYVAIAQQEVCTNQGFKSIVPNKSTDYMFLYYLLKYNREKIENLGSGTTFKEVSGSTMRNVKVRVPASLEEQKQIASVLSSLDDKIEKNVEINENLEKQAEAIFKSWFVDFKPFGGNMPSDWKLYRLSDFLPVITGKKNANVSSDKGKYPFFSCSQNYTWVDDYSFDGNAILVAGNGDFNVKFYNGKFEAYQRTYVLIPYEPKYTAWLFYAVKFNLENIISAARGSVIKFITKGNLENFEFVGPQNPLSLSVIDTLESINKEIATNNNENLMLSTLRDMLLHRLMSGELDVSALNL